MRKAIGAIIGLSLLLMAQTITMPMWLPFGLVPDLLLLTIILVGFLKPTGQAFWLGLILGLFQGWIHGRCWWAFAISRSFAGVFAGWMKNKWLWQSPPAAGFCAAVTTTAAEIVLAILLALSERSLTPFNLLLPISAFETTVNAVLGFVILQLCFPKEAAA